MLEAVKFGLNKEFRDRFQQALNEHDNTFILQSLEGVNAADITSLLYEFNSVESKYVLDMLSLGIRAEIISALDSDTRGGFLKTYAPEELIAIVDQLDSDDAADILNELPIKVREEILVGLDSVLRSRVIDLLRYDENVAGGLMAKELITARVNWTVVQCIEEIRKQVENVSRFYAVYVVDDQYKLLGRVHLQKLILTDSSTLVKDIYDPELISVQTHLEDTEVASIMRKYDLESVPVVNVYNQLVGRITVDDVLDVITEQADEERQLMSGISEDVEEADSLWRLTRARLPWLLIGIMGGLISVQFIGAFAVDLMRVTAIAFFIPLIQATGGNVGIQSSTIVVQSLANPGFVEERLWGRLRRVFAVALLNGFLLSLIVFLVNLLVGGENQRLFIVVSIALFTVVLIASLVGTLTPLILNKFGFNPALASGPFITTTNDLLGLGVYFLTIHLFL
ncbi:MAG: magnesium transporter [Cyclobacteriaceae bacterium]|nr:magnesium transporter [Cyclobacteriaceae bacterium]